MRIIITLVVLYLVIYAAITPDPQARLQIVRLLGVTGVYAVFQLRVVVPLWNKAPHLDLLFAALHGLFLAYVGGDLPVGAAIITLLLGSGTLLFLVGMGGRTLGYIFLAVWTATTYFIVEFEIPLIPLEWYFAFSLASGVILIEMTNHWRTLLRRQMGRLTAINQVSRALAKSIETSEVVRLLSAAIQEALSADTYFIALLKEDHLRLEVLYDDGQFFDPIDLDKETGLAGWVLKHNQTLLMSNVPEEIDRLGVQRRIVGTEKTNLSWLGTPMESGGHLVGLIAVGSYREHAFDQNDREMLESIAQLAAQAIVNALHYDEIQEKARRDSLTGAYNHAYFIASLERLIQVASEQNQPLGLIMLDIDYFKEYNDNFGHQLGDEVLLALTQAIQNHTKADDVFGRWGGEEFGVVLPNATPEQVLQVALRIRNTMRKLKMKAPDGREVPAPTVSQGLAFFPQEASDAFSLIYVADQRLYIAKNRGRDQIEAGELLKDASFD